MALGGARLGISGGGSAQRGVMSARYQRLGGGAHQRGIGARLGGSS